MRYLDQIWIISEFAKGCKLKEYLDFKYSGNIDEVEARELILQLLRTVSYCHQKGMTFGELSHECLFISDDGGDDYIDEFAREDSETDCVNKFKKIEILPTVSKAKRTSDKYGDIKSIGVILYMMIYGKEPSEEPKPSRGHTSSG